LKINNFKSKKIYIIGLGKVGSALYQSLKKSGFNISFATDVNTRKLKLITSGNKKISLSNKIKNEFLTESGVIVFTVTEKYLNKVITECRKFKVDLSGKIIFHTSGIQTSRIFDKFMINKDNTGSFHPLQTFNEISLSNTKLMNNIYFGIEGGKSAMKYFIQLIKSFKSNYVIIPQEKKILYHNACVIASNFLVSHLSILSEIVGELNLRSNKSIEIFKPIIYTTIDNIFKVGTRNALTGPFQRGDVDTIDSHSKLLSKNYPAIMRYYSLLGKEALKISVKRKSISKETAKKIEKLLNKNIQTL
jgi:predicted short-subunit dehydrogenase-like oxidoreductase (DUF2520 family)